MTSRGSKRFPTHHGYGDVRVSRYFALYLAQVGWLAVGVWLFATSNWPSSCQPDGFVKLVRCSIELPDTGGLREAALFTWLWSTPMLVALEAMRRVNREER